jgi:hypothetical protein
MLLILYFSLVEHNFDVEISEIDRGLLPVDTANSQAPGVPSELESFDRCAKQLSRIVDLGARVLISKHQTMTAMDQAKKLFALSQKVSSLEDQMSVLMAWILQFEECDLYMTKIIEVASEQLSCKFAWIPLVFLSIFLCVCFNLLCVGVFLDPVAEDRRVSEWVAALRRVSSDTNTFWANARHCGTVVLLQDRT